MQAYPQYSGLGALGWMKLMDGSSEDFTLYHIGMWALNLYPGRDFTYSYFGGYPDFGVNIPVIVAEFGNDAMDTDAWYYECINKTLPDEIRCGQTEAGLKTFVDEFKQADWTMSLVESIELHATTCEVGCLGNTISGGTIMAWVDETWKGRVIDSLITDKRSDSMSCPETDAVGHSLCGYPADGQYDSFVNEEWFGMTSVEGICPISELNQLRPRLVWHGLKRMWHDGGCVVPNEGQSIYSKEEYPLCSSTIRTLKLVLNQEREIQKTNDFWLTFQRNDSNSFWIAKMLEMSERPNGDSACELMQLVHDYKPELCPAAPAHLVNWTDKVYYSPEFQTTYPSECYQGEDISAIPVDLPLASLFLTAAGMFFCIFCACVRCTMFSDVCEAISLPKGFGVMRNKQRLGMRKERSTTPDQRQDRSLNPVCELRSRQAPGSSKASPTGLIQIASNPSTGNINHEFSQAHEAGSYVREVLRPIALRLCSLFGFQTSHNNGSDAVSSNAFNAVENVATLLLSEMRRITTHESPLVKLSEAVTVVHEKALSNHATWCRQQGLSWKKRDWQVQIHQLVLWFLIWGEAANIRLMPELLTFIFHCTHSALDFEDEHAPEEDSFNVRAPSATSSPTRKDDASSSKDDTFKVRSAL
ncbi:MAG: hypothetical protein SGPRY_000950 [Prymnesium sp.]